MNNYKMPAIKDTTFWLVGGSVRDMFIDVESTDEDYVYETTLSYSELAEELANYGKVNTVGKSFMVIKFKPTDSDKVIDIALPRSEKSTGNGHRDFEIKQCSVIEDLKRRDFTMNAIAYNPITGVFLDPCDGVKDMLNQTIRECHRNSISEDYLRALRAIRFAYKYDFRIHSKLMDNILDNKILIKDISMDRVKEELMKTLSIIKSTTTSNNFSISSYFISIMNIFMNRLPYISLLREIYHANDNYHYGENIYTHTLSCIEHSDNIINQASNPIAFRLAVWLHDIGKVFTNCKDAHFYGHADISSNKAREILTIMRFDNHTIDYVCKLVKLHMIRPTNSKEIKRLIVRNNLSQDMINDLLLLQNVDLRAIKWQNIISTTPDEYLKQLQSIVTEYYIENNKEKFRLDIDGNDIISLGYPQGPIIGKILSILTNKVLDNELPNDYDELVKYIR